MNDSITVTFSPSAVITWLIIGAIAGLLAGLLMRGHSFGMIGNIVVGLIGALIGGFLFTVLQIHLPAFFNGGIQLKFSDMLIAFVGAVIILLIASLFYRRRGI